MPTQTATRRPLICPRAAVLADVFEHHGRPLTDDLAVDPACPPEQVPAELAILARRHGFAATIYTWNLNLFDPDWFSGSLLESLERELSWLDVADPAHATLSRYCDLVRLGGFLIFEDPTPELLVRHLGRGRVPVAWTSPECLGLDVPELRVDAALARSFDRRALEIVVTPPGSTARHRIRFARFVMSLLLGNPRAMMVLQPIDDHPAGGIVPIR